MPFIGHNKADDFDDDGSALENTAEDVFESVVDWFNNSTLGQILKYTGYVILGIIIIWVVLKVISWLRSMF